MNAAATIPDRRQDDLTPLQDRRLSPMARRVMENKAAALRVGGDRPMGTDGTTGKAA